MKDFLGKVDVTGVIVSHPDIDHYNLLPDVFPEKRSMPVVLGGMIKHWQNIHNPSWLGWISKQTVYYLNGGKDCFLGSPTPCRVTDEKGTQLTQLEWCGGSVEVQVVAANTGAEGQQTTVKDANPHSAIILLGFPQQPGKLLLPGALAAGSGGASCVAFVDTCCHCCCNR